MAFTDTWDDSIPSDSSIVAQAASQIRDLKRDFRERINAFMPIGAICEWFTETPPDGWDECDGGSLVIASYPDLFSVLGYRFGGSGANFNKPDLRGIFIRAWPHRGTEYGFDKDIYTHITGTGTLVKGSAVVTMSTETTNLKAGFAVSGTGIPTGTTILTVDSLYQITLTQKATQDVTDSSISFYHINIFCVGDVSGTAITSVTNLLVCPRIGAVITGTGIPADTTITAMSGFDSEGIPNAFTISQAAAVGSSIALTIENDQIGSIGYDFNKTHTHAYLPNEGIPMGIVGYISGAYGLPVVSDYFVSSGGNEARPKNTATMYIIRTDTII